MNACEHEFDKDGECTYCGSITSAKAIELLKQPGTQFSGADWKYGWPHKFYIEPINPDADKTVEVGSEDAEEGEPNAYWRCFAHGRIDCACPKEERVTGYWSKPIMGKRARLHFKFYNNHLKDASEQEFQEFAELSKKLFQIEWGKDEKGIHYRAPRSNSTYGFQNYGVVGEDGEPDFSAMESLRSH